MWSVRLVLDNKCRKSEMPGVFHNYLNENISSIVEWRAINYTQMQDS